MLPIPNILSKFNLAISANFLIITYLVLQGLTYTGFLAQAQHTTLDILHELQGVVQHCIPKLGKLSDFWNCLDAPHK